LAEIKSEVDGAVARLRLHPFVAQAGKLRLSAAQGRRWIFCAGLESRSFPEILAGLIKWTENRKLTAVLEENLADELGRGNSIEAHFAHYLQLLDKLNIDRSEFEEYRKGVGVSFALSIAYNIASSRNEALALGYMLVNEAMTPVTYAAANSVLTQYYPTLQTDFFTLHIMVDQQHVEALYSIVDVFPESAREDLVFGVRLGVRGMEALLDEAYGVFDNAA